MAVSAIKRRFLQLNFSLQKPDKTFLVKFLSGSSSCWFFYNPKVFCLKMWSIFLFENNYIKETYICGETSSFFTYFQTKTCNIFECLNQIYKNK